MPDPAATSDLKALAGQQFCYLTTTGRVSGLPREIEIWFGAQGSTVYMLSGGREKSNWVQNIKKTPAVTMRIVQTTFSGTGRVVTDKKEDRLARKLLLGKYATAADDLAGWGRDALPIAIDIRPAA